MKIKTETLKQGIGIVINAASTVSFDPELLKSVWLGLTEDKLIMKCRNERSFAYWETDIENPEKEIWVLIVKADRFSDLINNIQDEEIKIEKDKEICLIKTSIGAYRFVTHPVESFVFEDIDTKEKGIEVPSDILVKGIQKCLPTVGEDYTRGHFTGVFLDGKEGNLVSSDGLKMSIVNLGIKNKELDLIFLADASVLLTPFKGILATLKKVGTLLIFDFGYARIGVKTLEGTFPDYKKLAKDLSENKEKIEVTVKRESLIKTMQRLSLFQDEGKTLELHFLKNSLGFKFGTLNIAKEVLRDIERTGEREITINLNIKELIKIMNVLESEKITIQIINETKPIVIQESNYTFITTVMAPQEAAVTEKKEEEKK